MSHDLDRVVILANVHAFDRLLLDLDGNVTETGGSNFLIAKQGSLISPTARNTMRGISRQNVIELCAKLAVTFIERDFQVHDVINAEEAFLTTTPYGIAPVTRINGLPISNGTSGPLFQRIAAAWSEQVGFDILEQNCSGER